MSLLQSTPQGASASIAAKRDQTDAIIADAHATTQAREDQAQAAEAVEQGRQSGLSWDQALAEAPPHIQTLMKNMRADYTRKTQELAHERKSLSAERDALLKSGVLDKLRATANEEVEFNAFDDASVSKRIEQEVARRLAEALAPLEQEHKQAQAKQEYNSFLARNPDLKTDPEVRKEVFAALQNNPNLDLEFAYYVVKGKRAMSVDAQREARKHAEKEAARAAALTATGSGKRAGPPTLDADSMPKKPNGQLDAWNVYQQLKRQRG
jgi:hypothetical protein